MPIYRATGLWIGPTGLKAQETWFCFELSAWYREIADWHCKIPDEFPKLPLNQLKYHEKEIYA